MAVLTNRHILTNLPQKAVALPLMAVLMVVVELLPGEAKEFVERPEDEQPSEARPAVVALPAVALSVAAEAQLMEALRSSSEVQLDYRLYPCHRRIPSEVELEALSELSLIHI